MESFFDVLLPLSFDNYFSYKSSLALENGDVVKVEFRKKTLFGVIVKKYENDEFFKQNKVEIAKIKEIIAKNDFIKISPNILEFIVKISEYNLASKGLILKSFIGFLNSDKVKDKKIADSFFKQEFDIENFNLKTLSQNQENIAQNIIEEISKKQAQTFLVDGVTGSGKTEIYFKIIADILQKKSGQVLIMLPEIALTSQLLSRFKRQFGFNAALWHSKISKKDKREIFYGIANGDVKVLIGARSSLLLPFKNLQLIVIDEEHDSSYKQEDIFYFNARDMAILKSKIDKFDVILSSATPSLESFYNAKIQKYKYFLLDEKFNNKVNNVEIIDLRFEKLEKNKFISNKLLQELKKNFENKQQSLLFINRRGYAPVMLCKACGEKINCINCSSNLVYHKSCNDLICHYCGHNENFSNDCKKCGEKNSMISVGAGAEKVREELESIISNAKIAVITSDNLSNFKETEKIINQISNNEIDVIIGTQMIAKGYDFPNLTMVGIVDFDSGLFGADIKSSEKTFQLLSQVFGRAGRKDYKGRIFVQTYNPENFILKKLVANDKKEFYNFELENRKNANLPPFTKMACIMIDSIDKNKALKVAKNIVKNMPFNDFVEVFGPAESPLFRVKNRYHYNIFVKVEKKVNLQKLIINLKKTLDFIDKVGVKINVDP